MEKFKAEKNMESKVHPPIKGFTHVELIDDVGNFIYRELIKLGVDPKIAYETAFSCISIYILEKFKEKGVEYLIPMSVFLPETEEERMESIEKLANDLGIIVLKETAKGIAEAPLFPTYPENSSLAELVNNSGKLIYDKIITLQDGV